MRSFALPIAALGLFALAASVSAQEFQANKAQLSKLYTGKAYSPYAKRNFPERPLWGDSHLHTSLSMDAGGFGNRVGMRDAYRLARGEEIVDLQASRCAFRARSTGWRSLIIPMEWDL